MFRVSYQDYRGWRTKDFKQPHPDVIFEDFQTKEEADRAKARLVNEGLTACVAPTPGPRLRRKRPTTLDDVAGTSPKRFNAEWKLHR